MKSSETINLENELKKFKIGDVVRLKGGKAINLTITEYNYLLGVGVMYENAKGEVQTEFIKSEDALVLVDLEEDEDEKKTPM